MPSLLAPDVDVEVLEGSLGSDVGCGSAAAHCATDSAVWRSTR